MIKLQVEPNHYFNESYDPKARFTSYQYQIYEIIKLKSKNVSEIRIVNGLVSRYLKERNLNISTLDVDKRINPDMVGSI